ncbi:MAG TPA: preprotein translocase subunit SecA, partial [Candidatus Omnitrophica bacterium]|nr:preprotein translocase subunit SecA [Candidatus Omnitrophota bacterium]
MLQIVDSKWKDHLYVMDDLKQGISLRAYGQKNPLVEYKNEGFRMFSKMIQRIKEEVTEFIFKVRPLEDRDRERKSVFEGSLKQFEHSELGQFQSPPLRKEPGIFKQRQPEKVSPGPQVDKPTTYRREKPKIGRNDPCPCGSGKKYKKCCGR